MFSHIVIFWTDPAETNAADEMVATAKKCLTSIPGIVNFHVGKMAHSHRSVVDQSYQVGLNIQFETKQAQDEYQDHPLHLEFVESASRFGRRSWCTISSKTDSRFQVVHVRV